MTVLTGAVATSPQGGLQTAQVSANLRAYAVDYWPPHSAAVGASVAGAVVVAWPVKASPRALAGAVAASYLQDYYYRVHIAPSSIDLGNLVTEQTRTVEVWNAWPDQSRSLTSVNAIAASGITVTGPGTLPLAFAPLQSRLWTLSASPLGPPVLAATLQWLFAGLAPVPVRIGGNRLTAWVMPADWGNPVVETLIWFTDVQQAIDGSEYREPLREAPRRQWEFDAIAQGQDRQQVEGELYDWTARNWALPVWPDMQWLAAAVPSGSVSIALDTRGLDFAVGSLAMLWTDPRTYEMVEVNGVTAAAITFANPTLNNWPALARLYPCRIARLTDAPKLTRRNDRLTTTAVRFEAVEPCDWPAVAPAATYLGLPVLEDRPDESNRLEASYTRQLVDIDSDTGLVFVDDITGKAWPTQSHAWLLAGLTARGALRSLLYWLQGKASALWVPSWADDLTLTAPVAASASTLTVAWAGITRHLQLQPGRRHLRIELYGGTVLYRRVTATSEIDNATEQLALDSAPGIAFGAGDVRQINWLMLCRLASDSVQIAHVNDNAGNATVAASWAGIGAEEP